MIGAVGFVAVAILVSVRVRVRRVVVGRILGRLALCLERLGDERDLANVEGYVNKVRGRGAGVAFGAEGRR